MIDLEDAIRIVAGELPDAIVREGDMGQRVRVHWPGQSQRPFLSDSLLHITETQLRAWAKSLRSVSSAH